MRTVISSLIALLSTQVALAGGFMITEQGARAMGRADAFTAEASDPSAVFYNPAGITQLGDLTGYVGLNLVAPAAELRADASNLTTTTDPSRFLTPVVYAAYRSGDLVVAGIGVNSPFGLGITWPAESPGRDIILSQRLTTVFVTPVVAVDLKLWVPGLSVAVGINVVPASIEIERGVSFGLAKGSVHMGGAALGVGSQFGVLYRPKAAPGLSTGLSWRTPVQLDFEGQADFTMTREFRAALPPDGDISTTVTLPHTLNFGVGYDLLPGFNAEVDLNWVGWSSYGTTEIILPDRTTATAHHGWHDTLTVRAGLEYTLQPLAIRAGYAYDPTPIPATSLDPTLPDANRHVTTLGLGLALPADLQLDAGFLYLWPQSRHTADKAYTPTLKGEYRISAWIVSVNLGLGFGRAPAVVAAPPVAEPETETAEPIPAVEERPAVLEPVDGEEPAPIAPALDREPAPVDGMTPPPDIDSDTEETP
jgi:long-chain fatty acid transport protein